MRICKVLSYCENEDSHLVEYLDGGSKYPNKLDFFVNGDLPEYTKYKMRLEKGNALVGKIIHFSYAQPYIGLAHDVVVQE